MGSIEDKNSNRYYVLNVQLHLTNVTNYWKHVTTTVWDCRESVFLTLKCVSYTH